MTVPMTDAVFFLCGIALPLAAIIIGFILWKRPPGINSGFGLRTKLSKSSNEAWYFSQRYSGKLLVYTSVPILAVSALVCGIGCVLDIGSDNKFGILLVLILIGMIDIAAVNGVTGSKLKNSFKEILEKCLDDFGERRSL